MFPTLICTQTVPAVDTDVTVIQSCDNNPAPTGQINTSSQSETSVNMDVTRDESNRVASQVFERFRYDVVVLAKDHIIIVFINTKHVPNVDLLTDCPRCGYRCNRNTKL